MGNKQVGLLTLQVGDVLMINEKYPAGVTSPDAWLIDSIEQDGDDYFVRASHIREDGRRINIWRVGEDE